jgi:hypothetical protein
LLGSIVFFLLLEPLTRHVVVVRTFSSKATCRSKAPGMSGRAPNCVELISRRSGLQRHVFVAAALLHADTDALQLLQEQACLVSRRSQRQGACHVLWFVTAFFVFFVAPAAVPTAEFIQVAFFPSPSVLELTVCSCRLTNRKRRAASLPSNLVRF